jgi:dTDP-4-amino-4,6-dideoxygalactose transaminase
MQKMLKEKYENVDIYYYGNSLEKALTYRKSEYVKGVYDGVTIIQGAMNNIYVTRSSMPPLEEYIKEIEGLWDSHWLTNMGVKHNELEEKLKDYLKVSNISLFTNGHMALELAIQAMNLTGEVITTPFTFASTTHAIVRNGLKPVFCDINPKDYTIDVSKIEELITDKTTAILPVHVFGNICEIEKIEKIAQKYQLKVIYDAAHSFGIRYKGVGVGAFGDASVFSFHATKVFNTAEGGAVCYHDEEYGMQLYRLKNFGIRSEEVVDGVGANAKMSELHAAMGLCNLRHVDRQIEKRKQITERYIQHLKGIEGIQLVSTREDVESNYSYFPVVFHEKSFGVTRNEIYDALREKNIYLRKYFYPLTNEFDCYRNKFIGQETPVALHISKRILALPIYEELELDMVDLICEEILAMKR